MKLGRLRRWGGAVALVCSAVAPANGHAAETAKSAAAAASSGHAAVPLPRIEIATVGNFEEAEAAQTRIASWFEAQGVVTERRREATLESKRVLSVASKPGVRLWLVLDTPTAARLIFAVQEREGDSQRYLVQSVAVASPLNELALERLAQVAYLSAVALWEGNVETSQEEVEEQLGAKPVAETSAAPLPRAQRASSEPEPRKAHANAPVRTETQPSSPPPDLRLGWLHQLHFNFPIEMRGPEGTLWGVNWGGGWARWWPRNFIGVRYYMQLFFPHDADMGGVNLTFIHLGWRAGLMTGHRVSNHLWLTGELMPQLEYLTIRPQTSVSTISVRDSGKASFGVMGSVGLMVDVYRAFAGLSFTLAVPFERNRYDVADTAAPGGTRRLYTAWPVEPGLMLTLGG